MASDVERILSASTSGISTANSSSKAITTSTVSKLSSPRSFWKWALGLTCTEASSSSHENEAGLCHLSQASWHTRSVQYMHTSVACIDERACLALINFLKVLHHVQDALCDFVLVKVSSRKATHTLPRCWTCLMLGSGVAGWNPKMTQNSPSNCCQCASQRHVCSTQTARCLSRTRSQCQMLVMSTRPQ